MPRAKAMNVCKSKSKQCDEENMCHITVKIPFGMTLAILEMSKTLVEMNLTI
jgi:hypothetical protein